MANQETVILYHGNCYDGFGAAWAAWKLYGDRADYRPVLYGQPVPNLRADAHVVILDFCYPAKETGELFDKLVLGGGGLLVIDHHETARPILDNRAWAIFDVEHSGAELAWRWFQASSGLPRMVAYLEDRDLWQFKLPHSREVSAYMGSQPFDFATWSEIAEAMERAEGFDRIVVEGTACRRVIDQQVALMADKVVWVELGGHRVPCANATVFFSEVGAELCRRHPEAPFSAYYLDRNDGTRQWGLRSEKGFNVAAVAKLYGGGGHPAAAGFQTSPPPPLAVNSTPPNQPIPMILYCPGCGLRHVDAPEPERGWTNPPHRSHQCHDCGAIWRPADVPTVGVERIETSGSADTWRGHLVASVKYIEPTIADVIFELDQYLEAMRRTRRGTGPDTAMLEQVVEEGKAYLLAMLGVEGATATTATTAPEAGQGGDPRAVLRDLVVFIKGLDAQLERLVGTDGFTRGYRMNTGGWHRIIGLVRSSRVDAALATPRGDQPGGESDGTC